MKCKHNPVLEIYKDEEHKKISHYRCVECGEKIMKKPYTTIIYDKKRITEHEAKILKEKLEMIK